MKKWIFWFLAAISTWTPCLPAQSEPLQIAVSQGTLAVFPKIEKVLAELNQLYPQTLQFELAQNTATSKLVQRLTSDSGIKAVILTAEEALFERGLSHRQLEKRGLISFDISFLPLIIGPANVTFFTELENSSVYMKNKPIAGFFWNNFIKKCIVPPSVGPNWLKKESSAPATLATGSTPIGFLMTFARLQGRDPDLPPELEFLSELESISGDFAHAALVTEHSDPLFQECQQKKISKRGFEWTIRVTVCDASHTEILEKIKLQEIAELIRKGNDPIQNMATIETRLYIVHRKDVRGAIGNLNKALVDRATELRLSAKTKADYSNFREFVTNVSPFVSPVFFVAVANTQYHAVKSSWVDFDDEWRQAGKTGREVAKHRIGTNKKPLEDDQVKALIVLLEKEKEYQESRRRIDSFDLNLLHFCFRVGLWHYWLWKHYLLKHISSRNAADLDSAAAERGKAKDLFAKLKTGIETIKSADPLVKPEYEKARDGKDFSNIDKDYQDFVVKLIDELDNG
jgi:hypothetical protein